MSKSSQHLEQITGAPMPTSATACVQGKPNRGMTSIAFAALLTVGGALSTQHALAQAVVQRLSLSSTTTTVPGAVVGTVLFNTNTITGANGVSPGLYVWSGTAWQRADNVYFRTNTTGAAAVASGTDAVAIGPGSVASNTNSLAIGNQATADFWSVALGAQANATGNGGSAIAIGNRANAMSDPGGNTAIAMGDDSYARHSGIAIGNAAQAPQNGAVALGWGANTTNSKSGVAIGDRAQANGDNAIAIGGNADQSATLANGAGAVALGSGANAQGTGATALGGLGGLSGGSTAKADYAFAAGASAQATGVGAVAIGGNNVASAVAGGANSLAVGAGATTLAGTSGAIAVGANAQATATDAFAFGTDAKATTDGALAIGQSAQALAQNSIAFGIGNTVSGTGAAAFGTGNTIAQDNTFVLGNNVTATQANSVILGNASADKPVAQVSSATVPSVIATLNADGTVTYAQGPNVTYGNFAGASQAQGVVSVGSATATRQVVNLAPGEISATSTDAVNGSQLYSVASQVNTIGGQIVNIVNNATPHYQSINDGGTQQGNYNNAGAGGVNSIAMGPGASTATGATGSVVIGANASATTPNSVALGADSTTGTATPATGATIRGTDYTFAGANPAGVVSVGSAGAERQIQNVAAGQLSATSTDAVNGSQLFATNQALETISAVAGAGINVTTAATGTGVAIGTSVANVGPGGVATYTAGNNMKLTQSGSNVTFAVSDNPNFSSVAVGNTSITTNGVSIAGGPSMTTSGINAGSQAITNVAPGVNGTDAVNVNQLNAGVANVIAYSNIQAAALQNRVDRVADKAYAGVASALAMESAPYIPGKTTYAAGAGYYQSQGAVGVSLRRTADNGRWSVTGGVAGSSGGIAARVGVTGIWD